MKCPKCGINLLEHVDVCPFCKTKISKNITDDAEKQDFSVQNTGRFSSVDPSRDSYDFDLQYTLTFRDSGEIKQAIADMDAGINTNLSEANKNTSRKRDGEPRYTLEEMQEAALRAQQRREQRNSPKTSSHSLKRKKRVSSVEKNKANALRSAKAKNKPEMRNGKTNSKRLLLGAGVLVIVIALIIGLVNIFAYIAHKDPEYPTVYTKNNELYSYYDDKETLLSANFITMFKSNDEKDDDKKTSADPKIEDKSVLDEKSFINVSQNSNVIYFFENINMNTKTGNLVYYEFGKKKRTELAQNVYYDLEIGLDGSSVLYLKNANENGEHGELCYWNPKLQGEVSIEPDITSGNFKFSQDCTSVTYIKNFNPEVHAGDLCYLNLSDGAETSRRVDERVAFVFGTTPKSKTYFYAKNYDTKTGTYDLYVQSDEEGPKMLAEKGLLAPVISQKTETAFIYSNYNKNFQTLSCVDLTTGSNTKLADEMTEIIKVRIDDGAVIYSKSYESDKADYYFVNAKSPNPQTVATAINLEAGSEAKVNTFDASDDFSRVAYIGGFDLTTKRGALYTLSIINDYAGSEMRISDDAYSCDVSADGAVVRFATSYSAENGTVNLVSYANSNTLGLADGVAVGAFTFDKTGEYAIYAKDVDKVNVVGKIQSVNSKGKIKELDESANAYGLKKDGTVILLKKSGEGANKVTSLYQSKISGGRSKSFTEGVSKILAY